MINQICDWKLKFDKIDQSELSKIAEEFLKSSHDSFDSKFLIKKVKSGIKSFGDERKLGTNYIFCYTILGIISPNITSLDVSVSKRIRKICINFFQKDCLIGSSESKKVITNMYAEMLGVLSITSFKGIADSIIVLINKSNDKRVVSFSLKSIRHIKFDLKSKKGISETFHFLDQLSSIIQRGRKGRKEITLSLYKNMSVMLSPLSSFEYSSKLNYKQLHNLFKMLYENAKNSKYKQKYKQKLSTLPFLSTVLCLCSNDVFMNYYEGLFSILYKSFSRGEHSLKMTTLDCIIHVFEYLIRLSKKKKKIGEKTLLEKLKELSNVILIPGKKNITSFGDSIHNLIADLIVMIANDFTEFAIENFVMNCLKSENITCENTIIGAKAFMALADEGDINRIQALLHEDRVAKEKYPSWVSRLLSRSNRMTVRSRDFGESKMLKSPFSRSNSLTDTVSISPNLLVDAISRKYDVSRLKIEKITTYSDDISRNLGRIVRHCDKECGYLLESGDNRKENIPKDKLGVTKVYANAIVCFPRVIPQGYSPEQLADFLVKSTIHKSSKIQKVSWSVCYRMLYFHSLRHTIVASYSKRILRMDPFFPFLKTVKQFVELLNKWNQILIEIESFENNKYSNPIVWSLSKFDSVENISKVVQLVDVVGIFCLCNLDPRIRVNCLKIWRLIRSIFVKGTGSESESSIWTVIEQYGVEIIKEIISNSKDKKKVSKLNEYSMEYFITNSSNDEIALFLNMLGKILSKICPTTCDLSLKYLINQIVKLQSNFEVSYKDLDKLEVRPLNRKLKVWKNFLSLSVSLYFSHKVNVSEKPRVSVKYVTPNSPKKTDLYFILCQYIQCNYEHQRDIVIEVLGMTNLDMLDILFENLKLFEKKKRKKKYTSELKIILSRIYSSLSNTISIDDFKEKKNNFVVDKFINFINDCLIFLNNKDNISNSDLQPLRFNLFTLIEIVSLKLFYAKKPINQKSRENLIKYVVLYSGYGKKSLERKLKERSFLTDTLKRRGHSGEKKKLLEESYNIQNKLLEKQASLALSSLLLGKLFSDSTHTQILNDWGRRVKKIVLMKRKDSLRKFSFRKNDSLPVSIFSWCNDVVCCNKPIFKSIGKQCLENILESNLYLLDFFFDQCYTLNEGISEAYFIAFVNVFKRKTFPFSLPGLITLVMYQCVSKSKLTRNYSLSLLPRITKGLYLLSSGLLDFYTETYKKVCEVLSKDYTQYAVNVIKCMNDKIEYISEDSQRKFLNSFSYWVKGVKLRGHKRLLGKEFLGILFEITCGYGNKFSEECKNFWITLAREENRGNTKCIISYLIRTSMTFGEKNIEKFSTCQRIVVYCGMSNPKKTVKILITELENVKDRNMTNNSINFIDENTSTTIPDVVLVLIVELIYKYSNYFQQYIPLIFQHCFVRLDHHRLIVLESCKLILVNLIYSLIIQKLNMEKIGGIERLEISKKLLKIFSDDSRQVLWGKSVFKENDKIDYLIKNISKLFNVSYHNFITNFGKECLLWAKNSNSFHCIVRSFQFYRSLSPTTTFDVVIDFISVIDKYMNGLVLNVGNVKVVPILKQIIYTIEILVKNMSSGEMIKHPPLFWIAIALLQSDIIPVYSRGLQLFNVILDNLNMGSQPSLNQNNINYILLSYQPVKTFNGFQSLIIRGLFNEKTVALAVDILSKLVLVPWDDLVDVSGSRLIVNIIGLLHYLCNNFKKEKSNRVTKNISIMCQQYGYSSASVVFLKYSKNFFNTKEKFLNELRDTEMIDEIFKNGNHCTKVLEILNNMLKYSSFNYKRSVLLFLHTLFDKNLSLQKYSDDLMKNVVKFVNNTSLGKEATRVIDVSIKNFRRKKEKLEKENIKKVKKKRNYEVFSERAGIGTKQCIRMISGILKIFKTSITGSVKSKREIKGMVSIGKKLNEKTFSIVNKQMKSRKTPHMFNLSCKVFSNEEFEKIFVEFENNCVKNVGKDSMNPYL